MAVVLNPFKKMYRQFLAIRFFEEIAFIFTLVTVINSLMMVFGWDQPKQGVFAYVHLVTRFSIITAVVLLWDVKKTLASIKKLKGRDWGTFVYAVKTWVSRVPDNILYSTAVLYTASIVAVCLVTIAFQEVLKPAGGVSLYQNLVLFFIVLCFTMVSVGAIIRLRRTQG